MDSLYSTLVHKLTSIPHSRVLHNFDLSTDTNQGSYFKAHQLTKW